MDSFNRRLLVTTVASALVIVLAPLLFVSCPVRDQVWCAVEQTDAASIVISCHASEEDAAVAAREYREVSVEMGEDCCVCFYVVRTDIRFSLDGAREIKGGVM